jgi:hypothetical protein
MTQITVVNARSRIVNLPTIKVQKDDLRLALLIFFPHKLFNPPGGSSRNETKYFFTLLLFWQANQRFKIIF